MCIFHSQPLTVFPESQWISCRRSPTSLSSSTSLLFCTLSYLIYFLSAIRLKDNSLTTPPPYPNPLCPLWKLSNHSMVSKPLSLSEASIVWGRSFTYGLPSLFSSSSFSSYSLSYYSLTFPNTTVPCELIFGQSDIWCKAHFPLILVNIVLEENTKDLRQPQVQCSSRPHTLSSRRLLNLLICGQRTHKAKYFSLSV